MTNESHGLSRHPLYGRWKRMVGRCTNPREIGYVNYGGRGVSVCTDWLSGPTNYIEYVERELGPAPDPTYTIDRIDNDRNYEPGNLRWASRSEQNANQRQRTSPGYPVGASGYKGVRLHKKSGLWHARIHIGGSERSLGYFKDPLDAAKVYDSEALRLHGDRARLNFPAVSR